MLKEFTSMTETESMSVPSTEIPSMAPRHGRDKQVYDENGKRQVVGAVPILPSGKVLLISSRKCPEEWILPKGGWENDETLEEAAARETWEEAGVTGQVTSKIGHFTGGKKNVFHYFELKVEKVMESWPEMEERERKWFDIGEALTIVTRENMLNAIKSTSIGKAYIQSLQK